KLVKREPDGLRSSRLQAPRGTTHHDTRTNEVGEGRGLGENQTLDFDPVPLAPDEEVLTGRKGLDALGEAFDEIFRISGGGLVSDRVHDAEHVLGAVTDLTHQEALPFLALLALRNISDGTYKAHRAPLTP